MATGGKRMGFVNWALRRCARAATDGIIRDRRSSDSIQQRFGMSQRNPEGSEYSAPNGTDEISLVDLVKAVLRRRKVFLITFSVILLAGIAVAFIKPRTYTYTSIYALANTGVGGKPLQEPAAALATVKSVYLPEQMERYAKASDEDSLPFKVTASNPGSTGLIVLESRASVSHSAAVKSIQDAALKQLESDDAQRVAQEKKKLTAQLSSLNAQLEALKGRSGNSMAVASALQNRSDAQQQLSSLAPGRLVALAKRSVEPAGIGRALIVVIAFVVGGLMALFGVFVAELAAAVKTSDS